MTPGRDKGHDIPIEVGDSGTGGTKNRGHGNRGDEPVEEAFSPVEVGQAPVVGEPSPDRTYEEALDHLRRLQAEFANYKRRVERERIDSLAWGQRLLVEKILPVLDDFDRAVSSVGGDDSPAAEGLTLIRDKLMRTLTEAGLERIHAEGEAFDPGIHEALMTQPVEPELVGTVLSELVPGFLFKGKLVRPVRVQVGVEGDEG